MAISSAQVTVGAAAVALNPEDTSGARFVVSNTGSDDAELGDAALTAGAGFPLAAGATVILDIDPGDVLYAVRATDAAADTTVAVLRT